MIILLRMLYHNAFPRRKAPEWLRRDIRLPGAFEKCRIVSNRVELCRAAGCRAAFAGRESWKKVE
jgi:hypothetical protein